MWRRASRDGQLEIRRSEGGRRLVGKSECTLRERSLPILVVCDARSCASLQTSCCVLVLILVQRQAAVWQTSVQTRAASSGCVHVRLVAQTDLCCRIQQRVVISASTLVAQIGAAVLAPGVKCTIDRETFSPAHVRLDNRGLSRIARCTFSALHPIALTIRFDGAA